MSVTLLALAAGSAVIGVRLWPFRHRPAIRRCLQGLSAAERAAVYAALAANATQFEPYDERDLAEWALRELAEKRATEGRTEPPAPPSAETAGARPPGGGYPARQTH